LWLQSSFDHKSGSGAGMHGPADRHAAGWERFAGVPAITSGPEFRITAQLNDGSQGVRLR